MQIPLPPRTRELIERTLRRAPQAVHPGLRLDKYVGSVDHNGNPPDKLSENVQKPTVEQIAKRSSAPPSGLDYPKLFEKRREHLGALQAFAFRGRAVTPLTLHLSRASALENAGLCLHHVYGFAYLPGTGLKGLARSYAETVWFPTQFEADDDGRPKDDAQGARAAAAWQKIEEVFGWSPNSDARKSWKPPGLPKHDRDDASHVGRIVFHDAWPVRWPQLKQDIVNCHHRDYYEGKDAPGDWESPVPVYFLAIERGQEFEFALGKRRGDVPDELLELARQWLVGGLTHFAAGSKTNSGYGTFELTAQDAALPQSTLDAAAGTWEAARTRASRCDEAFEVELVTPAFLAGAVQYGPDAAQDCDLRPATLRGMLRWWWRTLHAGFMDHKTLLALESALWGDTAAGGAIRIEVTNVEPPRVAEYRYKAPHHKKPHLAGYDPDATFARQHRLGERPRRQSSRGSYQVTQGLFYASYGMDENVRDEQKNQKRRSRWHVEPGARWRVRIAARSAVFTRDRSKLDGPRNATRIIRACHVFKQAEAALWLLCTYGGVGSKARKGFGSLQLLRVDPSCNLEWYRAMAAELRKQLGLSGEFRERCAESAAWDDRKWAIVMPPVTVSSHDPWQVMDHVGFAYQDAAHSFAHEEVKVALGLPRKINGPMGYPLWHQDPKEHKPPEDLGEKFPKKKPGTDPKDVRHASPVWIHVERTNDGHVVRAVAFPAMYLPDLKTSRSFLTAFMRQFEHNVKVPLRPPGAGRGGRGGGSQQPRQGGGSHSNARPAPAAHSGPILPSAGEIVEAELLEEKTKKGGWKARHLATGISGPIQNSADVPADAKPGDRVQLIVAYARPTEIAFRYPTQQDIEKRQKGRKK